MQGKIAEEQGLTSVPRTVVPVVQLVKMLCRSSATKLQVA